MLSCEECGANLPVDKTCRNLFQESLSREYQQEFGPGAWSAHGLTVSAYILQHPGSHPPKLYARARAILEAVFEEAMDLAAAEKALRQRGPGSERVARYRTVHQTLTAGLHIHGEQPGYRITVEYLYAERPEGHEERVNEWARVALEDQNAFLTGEEY